MKRNRINLRTFILNIYYTYINRGYINHVFGDIHYVTLGLTKLNTILTILDCVMLSKYNKTHPLYWFYWLFWYKIPTNRCKIITTISQKSKNDILKHLSISHNKIVVIPVHYDSMYRYTPKIFFANCPKILHIGIANNKNLIRVIEALNTIKCELIIIGQPTMKEFDLLKKYKINYNCHFNISQAEMLEMYIKCDMLIFASTYEGFGMPIIEAQAVGRVVITSNIEPMISVAGEGAHFVNPYIISEIRNAVYDIINNEGLRTSLISKGLINKENYKIETITKQYFDLYTDLLKESN